MNAITFTCGHRRLYDVVPEGQVECSLCGCRRVANVSVPPPKVRAVNCDAKSPLLVKE